MRCCSLYPTRWPARPLPCGYLPTATLQAAPIAAAGTNPACQLTDSTSASGLARDCRRSDAPAAVMQVRPLSVSSGTAGWSRFGRSPFGPLGWL